MANFNDNVRVIDAAQSENFLVEVIEYQRLEGSRDLETARQVYYANQSGIRLKQVRIQLRNGEAVLEPGALHFMQGHITATSKAGGGGLGGLMKGMATKMLTNETFFRPRYTGTGTLYLEPSFGHFLIHPLERGQALIVDKGMFYCCEGTVDVSVAMQRNVTSGVRGGEGWFQTRVAGPGICVFASPVPAHEVLCCELHNEKLQVDGNFALMRTESVVFSVQKSTKSWVDAATSGEGWLQTFDGTGKVWIAPTQAIYDRLTVPQALQKMVESQGSSHTQTG